LIRIETAHPHPFPDGPRWPRRGTRRAHRLRVALNAAWQLQDPWRFIAREALEPDGRPRPWQLRRGGTVVLRSGTSDIDIFDEIYRRRIYEPPAPARTVLERRRVELVADVGANVGIFAVQALHAFPRANVISLEPDPRNCSVLAMCRARSGAAGRWSVQPVAAAAAAGTIPLVAVGGALSHCLAPNATPRAPVIDVEAVDALPLLCEADFVKIDIEGSEWPLLSDARLARSAARVIVVEYHSEHCPAANAGAEARRLLELAGYHVEPHGAEQADVGQLWAWR
jgi:FkbM family methyltransferase